MTGISKLGKMGVFSLRQLFIRESERCVVILDKG